MNSLAKPEKVLLLSLARRSIERRILQNLADWERTAEENLKQPRGAFVTLHHRGELRGCIGRTLADRPLERVVQEMAIAAATQDPRFPPVKAEEIADLIVEISVLSPPRRIQDIQEIRVGEHGLIVRAGAQSGLLLPQVAQDEGWDVETFLSHTCLKAGLPMNYWQEENPVIEIFSAEVFSEKDSFESAPMEFIPA